MIKAKLMCENGEKIKIEEDTHYYTLTVGKETWYLRKDNGKFDGHSKELD